MRDWQDTLGCPYCSGSLRLLDEEGLCCPHCGRQFVFRGRTPALMRAEDATMAAEFATGYRQDRLNEGWRPIPRAQALDLPFSRPAGYPPGYWELRTQTYRALAGLLAREGPLPDAGPAADLGAGTGWLSHRLAQQGYQAFAVEVSLDEDFGLGASSVYFESSHGLLAPVQGSLEFPPFQLGSLSLILFNASLHYAQDLGATLHRAAQAMKPEGRLVIMDSPISRLPQPGTGRGDRHLGRQELDDALSRVGLIPRWITVRRGPQWWAYQLRAWLKRKALFSFPMVVAERGE